MGRSLKILCDDLRAIHGAVGEVLSYTQPKVPSWRFPEKLSTSVTLEDVLAGDGREPENGEDLSARAGLLDGIIDRLLLLLQSSLKLWNEADGRPSHPLPLSLSSTVKKYSKRLVQKVKHEKGLHQQLILRDKKLSELTSSLSEAQEQCQLLQDALTSATSATTPSSILPRDVPYEARNSLMVNRLHSSQRERQSLFDNTCEKTQPLPTSTSSPLTTPHLAPPSSSAPSCACISTQTAETAFALCVRCTSTQSVLTSTAGRVQRVCSSLQVPSLTADTDWAREAELGVLEVGRWVEAVGRDLERIETLSREQEMEVVCLREQLTQKTSHEKLLQTKLTQLSLEHGLLEGVMSDTKMAHTRELASSQEAARTQLSEMRRAHERVEEQRYRLELKLSQIQNEKDELLTASADIERQQCRLKAELLEGSAREKALHDSQVVLQDQLEQLQTELSECRHELEAERLHLSRTVTLNNTLQRRHEASLNRQREVLQRIEEMDVEAGKLRRELSESLTARDQLAGRVEELQTQCSSLQGQVAECESKLEAAADQQQKLCDDLTGLEHKLASLSSELEEEREKCRLLVTCPELTTTQLSSGRESQKYISANTIRILLLEEQNSELRQIMTQHARQRNGRRITELAQPIPLWDSGAVSEMQAALLARERQPSIYTAKFNTSL